MTPTPLFAHKRGIYLKAECLQPGGSYKIRGVRNFFAAAEKEKRAFPNGVSTVSAGNLGRALAEAAREKNIPCTIFVPGSTPENKKQKIKALGATLIELPFEEIFRMVQSPPTRAGFLHPLLTPELLEGYGEIAQEIVQELPDIDVIVAPFGLGGLSLGIARALKAINPRAGVIAAELEGCAPYKAALSVNGSVKIPFQASFVDAIGTPEVLPYVFGEAKDLLGGSLAVSLQETRIALLRLHQDHNLRVEGAAAVALAAGEKLARLCAGAKIAVVLSGSNIDLEVHNRETHLAQIMLNAELSSPLPYLPRA